MVEAAEDQGEDQSQRALEAALSAIPGGTSAQVIAAVGLVKQSRESNEPLMNTLLRMLSNYVPRTKPEKHQWERLSDKMGRCRKCRIIEKVTEIDGELRGLSDEARGCDEALPQSETLTLTLELDGSRGRETIAIQPLWSEPIQDLRAMCGLDIECEWLQMVGDSIKQHGLVRLALLRLISNHNASERGEDARI